MYGQQLTEPVATQQGLLFIVAAESIERVKFRAHFFPLSNYTSMKGR
jgi:hypothetical protein